MARWLGTSPTFMDSRSMWAQAPQGCWAPKFSHLPEPPCGKHNLSTGMEGKFPYATLRHGPERLRVPVKRAVSQRERRFASRKIWRPRPGQHAVRKRLVRMQALPQRPLPRQTNLRCDALHQTREHGPRTQRQQHRNWAKAYAAATCQFLTGRLPHLGQRSTAITPMPGERFGVPTDTIPRMFSCARRTTARTVA